MRVREVFDAQYLSDPIACDPFTDRADGERQLIGADVLQFCIDSLVELCAVIAPAYMARVDRIGQLSIRLARSFGIDEPEGMHALAFLSLLGSMTLPELIVLKLHRGQLLTSDERAAVRSTPRLGDEILGRLRGYERQREIIRLHNVHDIPVDGLPLESAILRVAIGYDRQEAAGKSPVEAVAVLRRRAPMYSSEVLDQLERHIEAPEGGGEKKCLKVSEILPGMVLSHDLHGVDDVLRLGAGHRLSAVVINRLAALVALGHIADEVQVRPSTETVGV
jgi:hypothetical protein